MGKEGSHTAGNSPGVNDGGGALVLASDEWASANGKAALAEIVAHAQSANDFAYLATTPARAAEKALAKAGLSASDIDLWEINEAFASVALQLDPDARHRRGPRQRQRRRGRPRATRSAPRARGSSARSCTSCAGAAAAWAARPSAAAAARATP